MSRLGALALLFVVLMQTSTQAAIVLTLVSDPTFGKLYSGASSRQFILGTNDTVTGTSAIDYVSGAAAGIMTVQDSTSPSSINIEAESVNATGGISAPQILCSYNGGGETRCDAGGYQVTSTSNATLKIGAEIVTSQVHSGGSSASVTFDITVTYL